MDVYGLVGNPVSHSLSPPMHEAAYDALDLDARYVTFEPDPDDLGQAIDGAAALGVAGLNVTVPFKRAVLDHVAPDDRATRVGAVNTVDLRANPPTGHNTDVAGARRALEHHDVALDGREAVVVGAGGAGRAVATALAEAGATVRVANRTVERARDLVDDLPSGPDDRETATDDRETVADGRETVADATAHGLPELPELLAPADVLVNATTVGMEDEASPVPADALHAHLAVMDAVYRPRETTLLRDAAARGARTVDGTWMLLFQGAAAFERWTGRTAPVGAMREALRSALGE